MSSSYGNLSTLAEAEGTEMRLSSGVLLKEDESIEPTSRINNHEEGGGGKSPSSSRDYSPREEEDRSTANEKPEKSTPPISTATPNGTAPTTGIIDPTATSYGYPGLSCLPMFSDRIRNNVKSRAALALLYVHITSTIAWILIFLLVDFSDDQLTTMDWAVPPVSKGRLGYQLPSFSISLTDPYHQPVPGKKVVISLVAVEGIPLLTTLPNQATIEGRTVNCLHNRYVGDDSFSQTDHALCAADAFSGEGQGEDPGRVAYTDKYGLATFNNFTVSLGAPVQYLLIVKSTGSNGAELQLTTFVTFEASVVLLQANQLEDRDGAISWVPNVPGPEIELKALIYGEAPPSKVAALVIPLQLFSPVGTYNPLIPQSLNGTERTSVYFDQPGEDENNRKKANSFVRSTSTMIHAVEGVLNTYEVTIRFESLTITMANSPTFYLGIFCFGRITLIPPYKLNQDASSFDAMYPQIFALPFRIASKPVVEASVRLIDGPTQSISFLKEENNDTTTVSDTILDPYVVAGRSREEKTQRIFSLVEAQLFQATISVKDPVTLAPVPNKMVYMDLVPSRFTSAATRSPGAYASATRPKSMIGCTGSTGPNGEPAVIDCLLSSEGALGLYDVYFFVDQTPVTWVNMTRSDAEQAELSGKPVPLATACHNRLTINVTSAILFDEVKVSMGQAAPWIRDYEVVGKEFENHPAVQVFSKRWVPKTGPAFGGSTASYLQFPVPGKVMEVNVAPEDVANVGVIFLPSPSDEKGWIRTLSFQVLWTKFQRKVCKFQILVESVLVHEFSTEIRSSSASPPQVFSSSISNPTMPLLVEHHQDASSETSLLSLATSTSKVCQSVVFKTIPSIIYNNVNATFEVQALTETGEPAADTDVTFYFHPTALQKLTTSTMTSTAANSPNGYGNVVRTDSRGVATWTISDQSVNIPMYVPVAALCNSSDGLPAALVLQLSNAQASVMVYPRVMWFAGGGLIDYFPQGVTTQLAAIWEAVNSSYPLTITSAYIWEPTMYSAHMDRPVLGVRRAPFATSIVEEPTTENTVDVPFQTSLQSLDTLPAGGLFFCSFTIDSVISDSFLGLSVKSQVKGISLIDSAFPSNVTTKSPIIYNGDQFEVLHVDPTTLLNSFGREWEFKPTVKLFKDRERTEIASGHPAIAQLGRCNSITEPSSCEWLEPTVNQTTLKTLEWGDISPRHSTGSTVDDGTATFSTFTLQGLKPGYFFKIRYCASWKLMDSTSSSTTELYPDVCVEESPYLLLFAGTAGNSISFSKGGGILPASPDSPIGEVVVAVTRPDGNPIPNPRCSFIMDLTEAQLSQGASFSQDSLTAYVALQGTQGQVTLPGSGPSSLKVSSGTPSGTYQGYVYCAGTKSKSFTVYVQSKVARIVVGGIGGGATVQEVNSPAPALIPGVAQNVSLNNYINLQVFTFNVNGKPVPNQALYMEIQTADGLPISKQKHCEGGSCGVLSLGSTVSALTDEGGLAKFFFAFEQSATNEYRFSSSTKERLQELYYSFGKLYGAPLDTLISIEAQIYGSDSSNVQFALMFKNLIKHMDVLTDDNKAAQLFENLIGIGLDGGTSSLQKTGQNAIQSQLDSLFNDLPPVRSDILRVWNPVQIIVPTKGKLEQTTLELVEFDNDKLNAASLVSGIDSLNSVPFNTGKCFQLLDSERNPVINATLTVAPFPASAPFELFRTKTLSGLTSKVDSTIAARSTPLGSEPLTSDSDGLVCFSDPTFELRAYSTTPGTYSVVISASGGGAFVVKDVLEVKQAQTISLKTVLMILAVWLLIIYSPLLVSSVL